MGHHRERRRAYCCRSERTVTATITLPRHEGGTVCVVRLFGRCPFRAVEIRELPGNPGVPATSRLAVIASWVREGLLECRHEPTWLLAGRLVQPHPLGDDSHPW
jgi:hypothetical protein